MKSIKLIGLLIALMFVLTACSSSEPETTIEPTEVASEAIDTSAQAEPQEAPEPEIEPLLVVATLFPQYDFARAIGGDFAEVKLLLPPGIESHSYEPTPQDLVMLESADVFLFTGEAMEPWALALVENLREKGVMVVDLSENVVLLTIDDHDHDHDDDHGHDDLDPHYWTDPNIAKLMVEHITNALASRLPEQAEFFQMSGNALGEKLVVLDRDIRAMLEKTESKTILSGGHFAFGYFVNQYGLSHLSPYAGFSPSAEPTPKRIAELIKRAKATGAKAVFYEELVDPKVARVIAEEAGLEMLLLHGVHNVSKDELISGKTYFDFMNENIENLKIGLGYNE